MQVHFMKGTKTMMKNCVILLCIFVFFSPLTIPVAADSNGDFNERINPGMYKVVSFQLGNREAIYTRFHITYGPGIYFFIVDQDGYDDIMAGREASTRYEENTYESEDGQWYYVGFEAPHDSTWYVWWSKASGAPYSGSAATIEGHARKDTSPPQILSFNVPNGPLSGAVLIEYEVRDLGFPISRIDLLVNGSVVVTNNDPENNHFTTGFEVEDAFRWNSNTIENGNYTISIRAQDAIGHQGESAPKQLSIENSILSGLSISIIVAFAGFMLILLLLIRHSRG
jgi:hypothetical protein